MSLCAQCGLAVSRDRQLCPHHGLMYGPDWAKTNRIMCDFFHRGIVPPRPENEEPCDFDAVTS